MLPDASSGTPLDRPSSRAHAVFSFGQDRSRLRRLAPSRCCTERYRQRLRRQLVLPARGIRSSIRFRRTALEPGKRVLVLHPFPVGMLAMLPATRPRTRLLSAALFLVLCLWLRTTLLPLFPIWLLGAALFGLSPAAPRQFAALARRAPPTCRSYFSAPIYTAFSASARITFSPPLRQPSCGPCFPLRRLHRPPRKSAFLAWPRAFLLHPLRRPFPAPDAYRRPRGRRSTLATDIRTHRCRLWHSGSDSRVCLRNCSIDGVPHGSRPNVGGAALRCSHCAGCTRCRASRMSPRPAPMHLRSQTWSWSGNVKIRA